MGNTKKNEFLTSSTPLFETHCHLDYLKDLEVEEVLKKANEVNVDQLLTVAVSPSNQDKVLELATKYDQVLGTQGVHPHEAKEWNQECREKIIKNCQNSNIIAYGEIGLDYHYNISCQTTQKKVFEEQLQLSIDLNLPIVIHSREAEEDTISILNNFKKSIKKKCVFHSFTSNISLAEFALQEGFYLGFNGIITFRTAENVREILEITPINRILLETDSPFLTPAPHRGKQNAPYYLPFVAKKAAEIKKMDLEEFSNSVYLASKSFFL
jgi:TatD DNase family protein